MFHYLHDSAWADGNLTEAAGQLGKLVEHANQSQPNPGPRAVETPCSFSFPQVNESLYALFCDAENFQCGFER